MALGIVDDAEFEKELSRISTGPVSTKTKITPDAIADLPDESAPRKETAQHKDIKRGRGAVAEIPEVIREAVAAEIISGGSIRETAHAFGVSMSSATAYANDATSTASYNEPNPSLKRANDSTRKEIIGKARSRLLEALDHITTDKLKDAKLRDVASVAKDMSAIIANTEPQHQSPQVGAQFIFHVPPPRKESDFEVIDVTS